MTTTRKTMTSKDVIRYLTLMNPDLTNAQIQTRLEWLNLPECSLFVISSIRNSLRDDVRFLEKAGMLRNKYTTYPGTNQKVETT